VPQGVLTIQKLLPELHDGTSELVSKLRMPRRESGSHSLSLHFVHSGRTFQFEFAWLADGGTCTSMQLRFFCESDRAKEMEGETNERARRAGIVDRGRSQFCLHLSVQFGLVFLF
jgi:hypothetical protein